MRFLTCYYKHKQGGLCKRLIMSMRALLDAGHEVHYIAIKEFPIKHPNCHYHRFPWPRNYSDNILFWIFFLSSIIPMSIYIAFRYKIDRIYIFSTSYGVAFQLIRILKRIPYFVFLRADVITNHIIRNRKRIIIFIETVLEGIAIYRSHTYAVSYTLLNDVISRHTFLKPESTGILRNNIEHTPTNSPKINCETSVLKLSSAGVLEPRKNQLFLLETIEKELKYLPLHLTLYGDGPQRFELENEVVKRNLQDCISMPGWQPFNVIIENTNLVLVPSLHEGAPNIILECLGYNIPVLASDIPEHREILPPACLIPLDTKIWARRIKHIILNPEDQLNILLDQQQSVKKRLEFDWGQYFIQIVTSNKDYKCRKRSL